MFIWRTPVHESQLPSGETPGGQTQRRGGAVGGTHCECESSDARLFLSFVGRLLVYRLIQTTSALLPSSVARDLCVGATWLTARSMDLAGASDAGPDASAAASEQQPELGARLQELVRQAEAQAQQARSPG